MNPNLQLEACKPARQWFGFPDSQSHSLIANKRPSRQIIKVLIASGASAGHLYPALAFAQRLGEGKIACDVAFVSSRRGGIEKGIAEYGFRLFFISISQFSFKSFKKCLQAIYHFIKSFLESFFIIEKFRPDLVVGFGSYVSFPVLLEAALFKKPTLIHEQNVSLGLANKALSFFVDKLAVSFRETGNSQPPQLSLPLRRWSAIGSKPARQWFGFPDSQSHKPARQWFGFPDSQSHKTVWTGNPLRRTLLKTEKEDARRFFNLGDKFTILTLGGSQGSHKINLVFRKFVEMLPEKEDFQFIHLTGKCDYNDLKKSYACIKMRYCLFDFLEPISLAYSLADLVISRAGAATIAELAYFQKAAILLPYPYTRGHQLENASVLQKEAAAVVIEEAQLTSDKLYENILKLRGSESERKMLERNIQKFAAPEAAAKLVELAVSLAQ